eukprot:4238077-Prorocentrum_lima.AAC.1
MVSADTPEVLLAVVRRSCSSIFRAYRLFGLPLNFAPDKTALMAFFAGEGATKARSALLTEHQGQPTLQLQVGDHSLPVIRHYTYLGVAFDDALSLHSEFVLRAR